MDDARLVGAAQPASIQPPHGSTAIGSAGAEGVTDSPTRGGITEDVLIGVTGMPEEQFGPVQGECGTSGLWGNFSTASAFSAVIGEGFPP